MNDTDGLLRAKWDGELSSDEAAGLEAQLAQDPALRERYSEIGARAERTQSRLSRLAPEEASGEASAQARLALARVKSGREVPAATRASWWSRVLPPHLTPAWSAVAAVAIVCAVLAVSAPARGLAQRILGLLRIQNVAVIKFDPTLLREGSDTSKLLGKLLSDSVNETKKPGKEQVVTSRDEASELVGFPVRLFGARQDPPRLVVRDNAAFQLTVDRARVQNFLDLAGRPDLELPESMDGATVAVEIPKVLTAFYGTCPPTDLQHGNDSVDWTNCVMLSQSRTPTVVTVPEFDLGQVAELGLQLAGMTPEEARSIRNTIDWTSTLVIPLPRSDATHEDVLLDGVKGILVRHGPEGGKPAGYVLIWIKYGILHALVGFGDSGLALPLVESLG